MLIHPCLTYQESCVRVLLYRGANKEAKNKHGQTPFQVNGRTIQQPFFKVFAKCIVFASRLFCHKRKPNTIFRLCLQLAVISGHFELGEIIKNHKDMDIGELSWQTLSSAGAESAPTTCFSSHFALFYANILSFSPSFHCIPSIPTARPPLSLLPITSLSALLGIAKVCSQAKGQFPHAASSLAPVPPSSAC